MIIKEKKSKLNLKYIWLIKIKPGFNRTVIQFFHSINQCFKDQQTKFKEKRDRKRDKDLERDYRHNTKYDTNDPMVENNDFTDRSIFDKKQKSNKKNHHHHHHHQHHHNNNNEQQLNQKYNSNQQNDNSVFNNDKNINNSSGSSSSNDNSNILNIPYVKGEIATDKKYFDNTNYLEELSSIEKKYNNELNNGKLSNETCFEFASKLSHSQSKDNRRKSINLFLELLNQDKDNQEKYLLEIGTTYYKQEDYESANLYIDKVLQSSPLNRQALSLKYLVSASNVNPPIQVTC